MKLKAFQKQWVEAVSHGAEYFLITLKNGTEIYADEYLRMGAVIIHLKMDGRLIARVNLEKVSKIQGMRDIYEGVFYETG